MKKSHDIGAAPAVIEKPVDIESPKESAVPSQVSAGPRKATQDQVLFAKLYSERANRIRLSNQISTLEKENAGLMSQVASLKLDLAKLRLQVNSMLFEKLNEENIDLMNQVGLKDGDNVTDKIEGRPGWHVVNGG
jgi:hypothetical protein